MMQQQPTENFNTKLFLLPRQYKLIGLIITAIGLGGLTWKKLGLGLVFASDANRVDPMKIALYIVLITGLMTLAWTREKVEDEFTFRVRYRCMGIAFIVAVLYSLVMPLIFLYLWKTTPYYFSASHLVTGMLLVYLVSFYYYKGKMKG